MKIAMKPEEAAKFCFSIFLFAHTSYSWWVFPAFIFASDISMLGYLVNTKMGAMCYNLFHHKAFALLIFGFGEYFSSSELCLTGIIFFGHSSMDRILGYGLKYPDSFQHTHLGWIGNSK